jgi:hypothetical protein
MRASRGQKAVCNTENMFRKKLLFFNTVVFSFNLICKYVVANKMIEKMKLGLLSLFEI